MPAAETEFLSGRDDLRYLPTYLGVVSPDMCDHLGHMNVQFYVKCFGDGAFAVMNALGLGRAEIERSRIALVAARMEIDYLAELKSGSVIRMESAITGLRGKTLTLLHRLFDAENDRLAARATVLSVCVDLDQRKSRMVPDEIVARVQAIAGPV